MKMNAEIFEVVKLVLQVLLAIVTFIAIPALRAVYNKNTTEKQRAELEFWAKFAVKWAEEIYKQRGAGALKKAEVIKYLRAIGFTIDEAQLNVLIDMIVDEFNKNGWNLLESQKE